jgi:hypothetical protein
VGEKIHIRFLKGGARAEVTDIDQDMPNKRMTIME